MSVEPQYVYTNDKKIKVGLMITVTSIESRMLHKDLGQSGSHSILGSNLTGSSLGPIFHMIGLNKW